MQESGVLLPLLFSIYIDDLLVKINRSGYGCSVGKVNIGAVAYADDICLLSGSSYMAYNNYYILVLHLLLRGT